MEQCALTGRAPCWPALDGQSLSTATGEGRKVVTVTVVVIHLSMLKEENLTGTSPPETDSIQSLPLEISRTSAWVVVCWTAQDRRPHKAPPWPRKPVGLSVSLGWRTAKGEVWWWSSAHAELPVPALPQILELWLVRWKNSIDSFLIVRLLVEMSGGRFSFRKMEKVLGMGWKLMGVGGKREY